MTEDRKLWAEEVERYAVQSMTCDGSRARNRELVSTLRRHASQSTASSDDSLTITYSIILQARSRLRTGRACGPDGISVELLESLSWRSVRAISNVFCDIFSLLRPTPREWQEVYPALMPKTSKLEALRQTRNLLVGNTLAK
eukprot:9151709-Pyramimonas_sp.AAC.1